MTIGNDAPEAIEGEDLIKFLWNFYELGSSVLKFDEIFG